MDKGRKYALNDIFVRRGTVFYPFEGDHKTDFFDHPDDVLADWGFDEFGFERRGWCRKEDLDYLQKRLEIAREVIALGEIKVGFEIFRWTNFDSKLMPQGVLSAVRREIERRVEAKKL
ncbi:MAG: hypothetical protein WC663_05825 [Patescibacteria group bacterium]|jgi:hypothetical protein